MRSRILWISTVLNAVTLLLNGQSIEFSRPPGFYLAPFDLELHCSDCDSILFTTDGSEPDTLSQKYRGALDIVASDALQGSLYKIPTTLIPNMESIGEYYSWQPADNCYRVNIVRARGYKDGISVAAAAGTWFVGRKAMGIPVVSVITDSLNLFDRDSGIYIPGATVVDSNSVWTGNYQQNGRQWERQVILEFYGMDGHRRFSQRAGMRMHGMKVVAAPQKSLRFYARKRYGRKWFKGLDLGGTDRQKRFVLRSSYSAWHDNIIGDMVSAIVANKAGLPVMDGYPVLLFINGEYWGLHTLRERVDQYYFSRRCGVPKRDVFFTENPKILNDSERLFFSKLATLANDTLMAPDLLFDSLSGVLDIHQFADYFILETFMRNTDWPFNNVTVWRLREDSSMFRFVILDMDACFSGADHNMFQHISSPKNRNAWIIAMVRHLMAGKSFPKLLEQRYQHLAKGALSTQFLLNTIDSLETVYKPYVGESISRWHYPDDLDTWHTAIEKMRDFARHRHEYFAPQLRRFIHHETFTRVSNYRNPRYYISIAVVLLLLSGFYFIRRRRQKN